MAVTTGSWTSSTLITWNYTSGGPNFRLNVTWEYDDETRELTYNSNWQAYYTSSKAAGLRVRSSSTPWCTYKADGVTVGTDSTKRTGTGSGWFTFYTRTYTVTATNDTTQLQWVISCLASAGTTDSSTKGYQGTQTLDIDTPAGGAKKNINIFTDMGIVEGGMVTIMLADGWHDQAHASIMTDAGWVGD